MAWIKVKWIKAHWAYGYFAGQVGIVDSSRAQKLLEGGFIIPLPDEEKEEEVGNPLPDSLPGRTILFDAGFKSIEEIKKAADSVLLDTGISNATLKKIRKFVAGK